MRMETLYLAKEFLTKFMKGINKKDKDMVSLHPTP